MPDSPSLENCSATSGSWPGAGLCAMPLAVVFDNGYFPVIVFLVPCLYITLVYLISKLGGLKQGYQRFLNSQSIRFVLKYAAYYLVVYFIIFLLLSVIPSFLAAHGYFPLPYLTWISWLFVLGVKFLQLALFLIMARLAWLCIKGRALRSLWE